MYDTLEINDRPLSATEELLHHPHQIILGVWLLAVSPCSVVQLELLENTRDIDFIGTSTDCIWNDIVNDTFRVVPRDKI